MKTSLLFILFALLAGRSSYAQTTLSRQVLAAAGETTFTPQGSLSWTVGEAAVGPAAGAGLSVNQGFQQSNLEIVSTEEAGLRERLNLRLYPNPTADILHLERLSETNTTWNIRIFSASGQSFPQLTDLFPAGTTLFSVDLSALPAGSYFLSVQGDEPGETGVVGFQKMK